MSGQGGSAYNETHAFQLLKRTLCKIIQLDSTIYYFIDIFQSFLCSPLVLHIMCFFNYGASFRKRTHYLCFIIERIHIIITIIIITLLA